nr:MAG: hypothetical protein TU36_00405 [Vulcanisaeta sp. AZ3]
MDNAVAIPFNITNTEFQSNTEYIVSNALPMRYGTVSLRGGTSLSANAQPIEMAAKPIIPIIIGGITIQCKTKS